jgi:hypothetical protein
MNNIRSKTPRISIANGIGNSVKRKAPSSPNQMVDLFKKVKLEKASSSTGGTTSSTSSNNNIKKQSINTCNIKTSTPTESPAKTQQTPQIKKSESSQPNLKLLVCRVCRNNYDSKHLPVLVI